MICQLCSSELSEIFKHKILNRYDVQYYICGKCEFICTENPFWLAEAYKKSINLSDTGILLRTKRYSSKISLPLYLYFKKESKFLDYGGGYGVFVRMMRDMGFDFYWYDKFTKNLFARGFEADLSKDINFQAVCLVEVIEHIPNIIELLQNLLLITDTIIFSTELYGDSIPFTDWHYYGFDHGQHISFFNKTTLKYISTRLNLNFLSNYKSLHVFSKQKRSNILFRLLIFLGTYGGSQFIHLIKTSKTRSDSKMFFKQ